MSSTALQEGDLVLVTGGTGWVGSHIVEKLIEFKLKIRLAVRNPEKAEKMIEALRKKHGKENVKAEIVFVENFAEPHAHDKVIGDVQGVIHCASVINFQGKWDNVVPPSIQANESIIKSAHEHGHALKRFVLTSSSNAVGFANTDPTKPVQHWTSKTFHEDCFEFEKKKDEITFIQCYAAAKTFAELFAWNFVEKEKPKFTLNVVVPNMCFGEKVVGTNFSSSGLFVRAVCLKKDDFFSKNFPSQYFVNIEDAALIHVLALTKEDIQHERILAFTNIFNWNDMIDLGKKILPPSKYNPSIKTSITGGRNTTIVERQRFYDLCKPFGGPKNLEESVRGNLQDDEE